VMMEQQAAEEETQQGQHMDNSSEYSGNYA
jgi:hypothetical protein